MVNGYMARGEWPTKNLSCTPVRYLWFKLRVGFDNRTRLGKRDSSVAAAPSE